tara:strand:- start:305 stop:1498 length:1194 start_codon:yes stop_codon:yes gene_type:complete
MLTRIQRDIARDILVMFGLSLFVMTLMVMLIGVAREALSQGLGVVGVLRLLPYAMPNALSLAVPGTALFSVCCVYGRMSADNEFTTLQSVGVSPITAIWPAIGIATLLSLATVGLINTAFTWGFNGIQHVVLSSVENVAYGVLQRERSFQHGDLSLSVRDVNGRNLVEPVIGIRRPNQESISIEAKSAVLRYNDEEKGLTLSVTDGTATIEGKASFHFPDTFVHTVPLRTEPPYDVLTANPSHMPMSDLPIASSKQSQEIVRRESSIAVETGINILTGRVHEIVGATAMAHHDAVREGRKRLQRLDAEMHRRWASGFTCFALAMVGVPLAIRLKTADTMTTFGIVFLPTLLVYYPIFALTLDMAKDGRIAACGVWIANAVFVLLSIVMMRKTIYSPV